MLDFSDHYTFITQKYSDELPKLKERLKESIFYSIYNRSYQSDTKVARPYII